MRAGCIAQDVIVSPASPNPARWYIHGAAQNRRGTVLAVSHILGAPSFSPHRSRAFIRRHAHSPTRLFAISPSTTSYNGTTRILSMRLSSALLFVFFNLTSGIDSALSLNIVCLET